MTDLEAARDFLRVYEHTLRVQSIVLAEGRLRVYTAFDLPEPLKERLATWKGYPVEFKVLGRVCKP